MAKDQMKAPVEEAHVAAMVAAPEPEPKAEPAPKPKAAEKPEPVKGASKTPRTFAEAVTNLPDPFRPRHLDELIRLHAAENGIEGDALAKVDPHRFLKEHGLPNPLKRFSILAIKQDQKMGPDEFDAVDPSEAVRLFALKHNLTETHQWKFSSFLVDY